MAHLQKWVVLIGLDFYLDRSQALRGCVNDIEDVRLYLEQNCGPLNITKFEAIDTQNPSQTTPSGPPESWPTYENITNALTKVAASASPGDLVHVHYSGHGTSTITTGQYQEHSDVDAALVLFDAKKGVRYLRGIELASLFDAIVCRGLKLTVVLDCCGSGGLSRAGKRENHHIRTIPWNYDTASASAISGVVSSNIISNPKWGYRDASTHQHWLLKPQDYTLIAACGPHEIASECKGKDGRIHGALSYFLLDALVSASNYGHSVSLDTLYRHICAKFHVPLPKQHPLLLGNGGVSVMSGMALSGSVATACNVIKVVGNNIWLNVGHVHSVGLGDEYSVHPVEFLNKRDPRNYEVEIKVQITAVHTLQSEGKATQLPQGSQIKIGWSARLLKLFRPKASVELDSDCTGNPELTNAIERSLWLYWHESEDTVSMNTLFLQSFRLRVQNSEYTVLDGQHNQILHLPLISMEEPEAMRQIVRVIEHLAIVANIETLDSQLDNSLLESNFSIDVKIKGDNTTRLDGNRLHVSDNAKLLVTFQNHTDKPLNLTVLAMSPLRSVSKLYPSRDRGDWRVVLPQHERDGMTTTGTVSFTIKMNVPESLKMNGSSQVEDVLKFFVTTRPASFASLELPPLSMETLRTYRGSNVRLFNFIESLGLRRLPGEKFRDEYNIGEKWACRNFVICTAVIPSAST